MIKKAEEKGGGELNYFIVIFFLIHNNNKSICWKWEETKKIKAEIVYYLQLYHPVKDISNELKVWLAKVLHLLKQSKNNKK